MAEPISPIRILAVNFPALIQEAMSIVLEQQATGTILPPAATCETSLSMLAGNHAESLPPDLLLFDLDNCPHSRLECLVSLRASAPATRILALAGSFDHKLFWTVLARGAHGVILKSDPAATMIEAIRRVHCGQIWLGQQTAARLLTESWPFSQLLPDEEKLTRISKREREVLALLGGGYGDQQIADRLGISIATVRAHLNSVRLKLEVKTRVQLVAYSCHHGLTESSFPPPRLHLTAH